MISACLLTHAPRSVIQFLLGICLLYERTYVLLFYYLPVQMVIIIIMRIGYDGIRQDVNIFELHENEVNCVCVFEFQIHNI